MLSQTAKHSLGFFNSTPSQMPAAKSVVPMNCTDPFSLLTNTVIPWAEQKEETGDNDKVYPTSVEIRAVCFYTNIVLCEPQIVRFCSQSTDSPRFGIKAKRNKPANGTVISPQALSSQMYSVEMTCVKYLEKRSRAWSSELRFFASAMHKCIHH